VYITKKLIHMILSVVGCGKVKNLSCSLVRPQNSSLWHVLWKFTTSVSFISNP